MARSGLVTFLDLYSSFEALFLGLKPMWGGQGDVEGLLRTERSSRILPCLGESLVISRCRRLSLMIRFDRRVRRRLPRSLSPLLRVMTRRRREWEVVAQNHFFHLFGLLSLDNSRNSSKNAVQNTLLRASVPPSLRNSNEAPMEQQSPLAQRTPPRDWRGSTCI